MLPDRDRCRALAAEGYNLIPVTRRLVADGLTAAAAFGRLQDEAYSFLFESVVGGESQARYSMLGCAPRARLVGDLKQVTVIDADGSETVLPGAPLEAVRAYAARFRSPSLDGLPAFSGGLVGYFGYDTVRMVEDLPNVPPDPLGLPDIHLMRCDTLAVFDHSFHHLLLITHVDLSGGADVDQAYAAAEAELEHQGVHPRR
ncbi:MAG: hypothetical protein ACYTF0_09660 [Planctomycetota bacterium]|jgi:anthranilate synthase component 1